MSQLRNGSELLQRSFQFEITDESRVGEVRRFSTELAEAVGFNEIRAGKLAIVVNELTTNLHRHADHGSIFLRASQQADESFVEIICFDHGPGFTDLDEALKDGVSSGSTPGIGLGTVRRMSDFFDIATSPSGTFLVSEIHANDESAHLAKQKKFRVAGICTPIQNETVSGDAWSTRYRHDGVQIALIDGLGHGPQAHAAAMAGVESFQDLTPGLPVDQILLKLHGALRATRGAAVSVADISFSSPSSRPLVDFAGAGNVRGVVCENGRDRTLITHAGTVGLQFKSQRPMSVDWTGDGRFIMHSDGIQARWTGAAFKREMHGHPGLLAAAIYRDYLRGTDDATVVVGGFYEGGRT